jgi:hypothetical protein
MGGRGSTSGLSAGRNLGSTNGSGYKSVSEGLRSGALIKDRGTGEIVANKDNSSIFYDETHQTSYKIHSVEYSEIYENKAWANMSVLVNGKWLKIKNSSRAAERIGTAIRKQGGGKYKIIQL